MSRTSVFLDPGEGMRSINGYFLFELGKIQRLLDFRIGEPTRPILPFLGELLSYLQWFVSDEKNGSDLPDSVKAANVLLEKLEKLSLQPDLPLTAEFFDELRHILNVFNDRLFRELGRVHVWVLEGKRAYGVDALWNKPLNLLPSNALPHLSDFVIKNIGEAAKSLLLDRYTAVGFHAMRSIEYVARKYYELITGDLPPYFDKHGNEYFKTLGTIANEFKQAYLSLKSANQPSGDLELIAGNLLSLNNIYRKTLAHIDIETLDEERAINALMQATDVIGTMIRDATTAGAGHFKNPWKNGDKF